MEAKPWFPERISAQTRPRDCRNHVELFAFPLRTEREEKEMPLLFYFPFIVWMGMLEVAHDEMRVPVKVSAPVQR